MKLVHWLKSPRQSTEWNFTQPAALLHHIAEDGDEDLPERTLCGIDLRFKPGLYTVEGSEEDGIKICANCKRVKNYRDESS